ncbi:probable cytochrome P450 49a1 isoform X1 [Mizuhopecten yessoensis]|uniref:Cytochrome P450 49a1 n=1 Tax=Mizuhopecten yessoensis TaxID=6573 RepID=A0A210QQ44_MIZYE|nr:probable cytochrome P450 49a1 isoform X1 [Mizuhopecten yessoensis]XP_021352724.1 probable cytochrome P450 49a1 isoform X1 [Mizuhopecten yessoensis]XP_021352725.1 probable cytochrome P450 49a1 isoform X1 [Mizuhopecten yessoensis]XP_021352727.1 probable cytochrome P450 49a1 isoform X1 [Mizuhopecten yessoensis]XP_021352728.1 probable cytochrome P450 49a1 isoform X1 [Mizuhopecten yessoensis]XP_021352729.1 probable cytochrome P450 49a1 isoform X1 [Mizuhopecten yessoensis]XP_021352730.1 probable
MRYPIQLSCWLRPRQRQFGWTRNTSVVTDGTKPKPLAAIPGPSGLSALPYIGLMFELKPFTNYDVKKLSELFEKYREQYGPLVKIRAGKDWLVCVYDPDDIAAVFRTESRHPYRGVTPLAKTYDRRKGVRPGLVTLKGDEWYALRSPTQKAMMRPKAMTKYAYRISQIADEFVAKFERRDRLDNLPDQLMEYTAEGVGMLCFNTRLGCITETNNSSELMEQTKTYLELFGESTYRLPLYTVFRTPMYRRFERAADFLSQVCENYIDDALTKVNNTTNFHDATVQNPEIQSWNTKQSFDADVQNTQHPTNVNTTDMEDSLLFDLLSTPGMTPDMTRRILVDVFVAGIDSTANAMTFLFYFLAKHQDKQRKLYQELLDVIPKDGKITEDVIKKLSYLKACVKESLRLVFPICAGTARILDLDIVLKGYKVPKGTTLVLCNGIICREERYFPQQDQFLPERWIRGDIRTDVNPFAHLPFGFGPRKCIGQRVAELEIYICTAKMFMTYRFKLPPGVDEIPYKYCTFATPREKTTFMLERRVTTWHS